MNVKLTSKIRAGYVAIFFCLGGALTASDKPKIKVFIPQTWQYAWVSDTESSGPPRQSAQWLSYQPFSVPANPEKHDYLWIKTALPDRIALQNNVIYIRYHQNIEQIRLGDSVLANKEAIQSGDNSFFPMEGFRGENGGPVDLSVLIKLSEGNNYVVQELWIGGYINAIFYRIIKDAERVFLSVFFILIGIASLFLVFKSGRPGMMGSFCIFTLASGVYVFMDTPGINMFFSPRDTAPLLIAISSLVLVPASLFKFLQETFPAHQPKWFRYIFYFLGFSTAFIILSMMVNDRAFRNFQFAVQLYLAIAAPVIILQTAFIVRFAFSGNRKIRSFTIGLVFLISAIINDTLIALQAVPHTLLILHWGIFIFILFLIQIIKITWFEHTEELKNYSKNLEHMVLDRTRKLESAQRQIVVQEKMAALGSMTAGIAHELKNPLNFINNFSELSSDLVRDLIKACNQKKPPADIKEITETLSVNLEKIEGHGKKANDIINSMLLHSRGGSGERRLVDINALLKESLQLTYHSLRANIPDFNIEIRENYGILPQVYVITQDISRVFFNILNNGMYATMEKKNTALNGADYKPLIEITTQAIGNEPAAEPGSTDENVAALYDPVIEIRIRDNGVGINEEIKEKLFEPFFTTKPPGKGTGLGLSICYDLVVKEHNGRIDVNSVYGEFSEFIIKLP